MKKMGKKDIQQSEEESRGFCRQCLNILQCCQLPPATGVKIVSIVSILIGLVFCCLGVWMIIVTTNNNELPDRKQVTFEQQSSFPPPPLPHGNTNGNNNNPSLSAQHTVNNGGDSDSMKTQPSLFDTSSVNLPGSSSSSSAATATAITSTSSSQSSASSHLPAATASSSTSTSSLSHTGSSSWPSSSISSGKGPSGRKPPHLTHATPRKFIALATYHNYLLCLGILSVSLGFVRTVASIFLLWNSVEKHSKTPGTVWIFFNVLGTVSLLVFLGVTLNTTGFIYDFPWRPMSVQNDRFNFYLLLTMFRIVCLCDIFLTIYFVLIVMWFVRTIN